MTQCNYDTDKIDEVKSFRTEYERELNVFLLGKILELSSGRLKDISVSDEIVSFEKNLRSLVLEFQSYIVNVKENGNADNKTNDKTNNKINNKTNEISDNSGEEQYDILTVKDCEYHFRFIEHGRYHWEEREYTPRANWNIASRFASLISGIVIASDGTVYINTDEIPNSVNPSDPNRVLAKFESRGDYEYYDENNDKVKDTTWSSLTEKINKKKRNDNFGWLIYRRNRLTYTKMNMKVFTINEIFDFVRNNSKFYK